MNIDLGIGIGFVLFMTLLGGVFAVVGDFVGRMVGKKRLNIFRLRPKHTAMVFTFVAGSLGTLLVIVLLSILVAPVKIWILEGASAKTKLIQAQKDLTETKKKIDSVNLQLTDANGQLVVKTEEVKKANTDKEAQEQLAKEAKSQADTAKGEAERVHKEIASTKSQLTDTIARLESAKNGLETAKKERDALVASNATLKTDNTTFKADNSQLNSQNLKLTNDNTNLDTQIKTLEGASKNLQVDLNKLNKEKTDAAKTFSDQLAENVKTLNEANRRLTEANKAAEDAELQAQLIKSSFDQVSNASRFFPMTVRFADELARTVVEAKASPVVTRAKIDNLVAEASRLVRTRNNDTKASLQARIWEVERRGTKITAEAQIAAVVSACETSREPMLIIARSLINSFKGEDAPITLEAIPNRIVYVVGQVIFEGRVDGSLSKAQIIQSVTSLILEGLRSKVIKDGIVPATGQDSELGEITSDQILGIGEQLKSFGRNARVQFVSTAPTHRGDKLKLEYRLKP